MYLDTRLLERPKYKLKSIWHLSRQCQIFAFNLSLLGGLQLEYTTGLTGRRGRMISTTAPDLPARTVNTDSGHSTKWVQTFIYYQTFRERGDARVILTRAKKKSHGDKSFRAVSVGIIIIIDKPQTFTEHTGQHWTQSALYPFLF